MSASSSPGWSPLALLWYRSSRQACIFLHLLLLENGGHLWHSNILWESLRPLYPMLTLILANWDVDLVEHDGVDFELVSLKDQWDLGLMLEVTPAIHMLLQQYFHTSLPYTIDKWKFFTIFTLSTLTLSLLFLSSRPFQLLKVSNGSTFPVSTCQSYSTRALWSASKLVSTSASLIFTFCLSLSAMPLLFISIFR